MNYSCVDVRPERSSIENHTDERLDACAASNVRRGDLLREAKDQSFRYRKDLDLPNQVCLFRHRFITLWRWRGNNRRPRRADRSWPGWTGVGHEGMLVAPWNP